MKKGIREMITLFTLVLAILLTACGSGEKETAEGGGETSATPAADTQQDESGEDGNTYHIRVACNDEAPRAENIILAAERLNEQLKAEGSSDVVTAEYILVDDKEKANNLTMWDKTGDMPELVVGNPVDVVRFADAGFIVDNDELMAGEAYQKVFPNLRDMGLYNDHYYGVIQDIEARPVWFFKNHLLSLGWTEEDIAAFPDKVLNGEFTQNDLQNLAKEAVDKDICEWGIIHRPTNGAEFRMMAIINGADSYRDGKVVIQKDALMNFFTFLRENVEMGLCPPDITTYGWDPVEGDMQPNGKTLCWYGGVWNKYDMIVAGGVTPEYVDENFIMTLPPVVNEGDTPVTLSGPHFYMVTTAGAEDPQMREYVDRVLELVLDPDIQMHTTIETSHLAMTQETADYPEYKEDEFLNSATYMVDYAMIQEGNTDMFDYLYGDETFFAAIQATEMTDEPVEDIVDRFIEDVKFKIGEGGYIEE
ncbi:MAG: ABC transporter substrate-binding protein [Fastidiosipilaceae bacterium]|jgi:inositol-phosphate transport system substrate-binding protein